MGSLQLQVQQLNLSLSRLPPQPKTPAKPFSHAIPHSSHLLTLRLRRPIYASAGNATTAEAAPLPAASLPQGLLRELMPNHVAVIMDGNRRWARMRGLPDGLGHEAGVRALRGLVELCCKWGIKVLTAFAFSADNWFRPQAEVDFLMGLFEKGLKDNLQDLLREDIRISVIGDASKLPRNLDESIAHLEKITMNNTRLHLVVAINYSGKHDIVQACRRISQKQRQRRYGGRLI